MELKNKKILVTGGAGFIGSHTVDALIERGADVVVVDNLSTGRRENLNPKAKFYEINISDPEIENIIEKEKPEIIYHFAFFVTVPKSVENPLLDMDCVAGSLRIFQKAKDIGVKKIVFSSSGFLYGNTQNFPTDEDEPIQPISPYIVSKSAIENYLKFYFATYGLPYVVLRYGTVYGPRQVMGAMADYVKKLSNGSQADIWGDGTKTRDYVFVGDVVDANLSALDVDDNHINPIFNIGAGKETNLSTLYQKIAVLLNKEAKPTHHPDRSGELMRNCLKNAKATKEMNWNPKTDLDEGLKQTLKHWNLI